jgi:hypothetical protein
MVCTFEAEYHDKSRGPCDAAYNGVGFALTIGERIPALLIVKINGEDFMWCEIPGGCNTGDTVDFQISFA